MIKTRVSETDNGIEGKSNVAVYDQMQRKLRDKGWIETKALLKHGITQGCALEIGPRTGYLGLEWLKNTHGTTLKGLDISTDMIAVAERNAMEYGLSQRAEYVHGSGSRMPFDDNVFDAVFSNGSLHEWTEPRSTFNEVWRILKPGGGFFISDLRRDMYAPVRWFLWVNCTAPEIRPGLMSSINASYNRNELRGLVVGTKLWNCMVSSNLLGVILTGVK